MWLGLLVSYFGVLLGCGLHIASSLWSVKYEAFNEAGGIILAVNQFAVLAIIVIPALITLEFNENVLEAIQCVALLFAVTFAVAALFSWKVWIVVRHMQGSELASLKKDGSNEHTPTKTQPTFRTTGCCDSCLCIVFVWAGFVSCNVNLELNELPLGGSSAFLPRATRQPSRVGMEKRASCHSNHSNHSHHSHHSAERGPSPNNSQNGDDQHPGVELMTPKKVTSEASISSLQDDPADGAPMHQLSLIITDADKEIPAPNSTPHDSV